MRSVSLPETRQSKRAHGSLVGAVAKLSVTAFALGSLLAAAAKAENLTEALVSAYENNPTLAAERAGLRAVDEFVPQALSGWRPTAQIDSSYGRRRNENSGGAIGSGGGGSSATILTPFSAEISVSQPLYRGGRTAAATREAKSNVLAARERLRSVEQTVLFDAVTAYMDVLRDQAVLALNRSNEVVLQRQLEATHDRFEVGEVTRTDVAQAEARLSRATSDRIASEGNLIASRAAYEEVVGRKPERLARVPRLTGLPGNLQDALDIAVEENPDLLAVQHDERASRHAIDAAFGSLLPEVSVDGSLSHVEDSFVVGSETDSAAVTAQIRIPLYQAGAVSSQVRQNRQTNSQRRLQLRQTMRDVREGVTQAWQRLTTASDSIRSARDEVRAAEIALDGVRQEAEVGLRTTLDVLDAEQELLDARVAVVQAERGEYVAAFEIRGVTGQLSAAKLGLPVETYDPAVHYDQVRDRWLGLGTD